MVVQLRGRNPADGVQFCGGAIMWCAIMSCAIYFLPFNIIRIWRGAPTQGIDFGLSKQGGQRRRPGENLQMAEKSRG